MKDAQKQERNLPMPNLGGLESSVVCSHPTICATAEACIKRSMEYAMGKRSEP